MLKRDAGDMEGHTPDTFKGAQTDADISYRNTFCLTVDICQAAAFPECRATDFHHIVGQGDGSETIATGERKFANLRHAVRPAVVGYTFRNNNAIGIHASVRVESGTLIRHGHGKVLCGRDGVINAINFYLTTVLIEYPPGAGKRKQNEQPCECTLYTSFFYAPSEYIEAAQGYKEQDGREATQQGEQNVQHSLLITRLPECLEYFVPQETCDTKEYKQDDYD